MDDGRGGCDDGPVSPRHLPPSVPVTALRVFEPLDAFPPAQRRALSAFLADPAAPVRAEQAERRAAWLRVLGRPDPAGPPLARVLRVEGAVLLCPIAAEPAPDAAAGWSASGGPAGPTGPTA